MTSHDSFGYFANRYGFEIVGVVLSVTTDVEPSAGDLADLVEEVKESSVQVVFGETTVSERLATAVAKESGAELVRLYSGSLSPKGSEASTYIEMIRTKRRADSRGPQVDIVSAIEKGVVISGTHRVLESLCTRMLKKLRDGHDNFRILA